MAMRIVVLFLLAAGVMAANDTNTSNDTTTVTLTTTTLTTTTTMTATTRDPFCGQIDAMTGGDVTWGTLLSEEGGDINGGMNSGGSNAVEYTFGNLPDFLSTSGPPRRQYWGSYKAEQKWPFYMATGLWEREPLVIHATGPLEMYVWLQGSEAGNFTEPGSVDMAASLLEEGFVKVSGVENFVRRKVNTDDQQMLVLRKYFDQIGEFTLTYNVSGTLVMGIVENMGLSCAPTTNTTTTTMFEMTRDPYCGKIDAVTGGGVVWDNSLALEDGAEINGGLNNPGVVDTSYLFYNVPDFLTTSSSGKWRRYWGTTYGEQKWPFDGAYVDTSLVISATGPVEMYVWLQGTDNKRPNDPGPGQNGTDYIAQALYDEGFSYVETEFFWRYRIHTDANQTMIVLQKYFSQVGPFNLTFATIPGRLVMGVVEDMSWVCTPTSTSTTTTTLVPRATSTNTTTMTTTNTTTTTTEAVALVVIVEDDDEVWVVVLVVALVAALALIASAAAYQYYFVCKSPVEQVMI